MFRLLQMLVKSSVMKIAKFLKNPKKALFRQLKPIKHLTRKMKRRAALADRALGVLRNTKKGRLIRRVLDKARIIDNMFQLQAEALRGKSSAIVDTPENVKDVLKTVKVLKGMNMGELLDKDKEFTKLLDSLNIGEDLFNIDHKKKSFTDFFDDETSEEVKKDLYVKAFEQAYDVHMSNGKNKFYGYEYGELGFSSQEEMDDVGHQIETERTYEGFIMAKIDRTNGNSETLDKPQRVKLK